MEQELKKYGYNCIIINSGFSDNTREESIRTLFSRRVEAIVLVGSTFQSENMKKAIIEYLGDLPVIIENGYIDLPNVYGVLADEQNGIADCVRLVYSRGKRHMAFINRGDTPSNNLKILGFQNAHRELLGCENPSVLWLSTEEDEWQASYAVTLRLMAEHPETDSIIYATDFLAIAGIQALKDAKYEIPGQVAVVGVDNSVYSRISSPRLTSLDNKLEQLSITCSNILIKVLNGEKVANKMMIFSNIAERETT